MDENRNDIIKSVESIITSVLRYAEGENSDSRNFFAEMEADTAFKKSYEKLESYQKKNSLSDTEVIQAQLINMMIEEDFFFNQAAGEYRYFEEDAFRSSEVLRAAGKSEGPAMIKAHRRLQLNSFGKKATKDSPGLSVVHKDPEYKAKDDEIKKMSEIADILANRFFFMTGEISPNFGKVLGATYQDWFDLDKICFFIRRTNSGRPLGMILIDPLCVKYILPNRYSPSRWDNKEVEELSADLGMPGKIYEDEFRYLLLNRYKTRVAKFTRKSMVVSHFFKGSSIQDTYKGCSVIEQAIRIVTSIINSLELNASRMTNNRVPTGILALQGASNINQIQLERFKKLLWAQSQGPSNKWKIPVVALPEKNQLQWVSFQESNKDTEYFNWMSLCFTILCRLSGTSAEELDLASNRGTLQNRGSLFQQSQEGIYRRSVDTGLVTFLNMFSEYFIDDVGLIQDLGGSPDWRSKFEGLDKKDEKEKEDLYTKSLSNHASLNEILAAEGKKPYKLQLGDLNVFDVPGIGNQNVFQLVITAIQQKQQEQMMQQQSEVGNQQSPEGGGQSEVGGPQEENSQTEENSLTEQDLALLQKYGISSPKEGGKVEKSTLKDKDDLIEIVIE